MKTKLIAAIILFAFASCKKNSDADSSSFSYQLKTSNRTTAINKTSVSARTEAASIQWTSGTASTLALKFEAKNSSGEVEFKQNTQQQIDLFAASSVLGNITIPQGTYSEVEFKALLSPSGNNPALKLSGIFSTTTANLPVVFIMNTSTELKAEKNNVTVAAGTNYSALNTIDLSQLTRGISQADLNGAALTNGTIMISSSSNGNLYAIMVNNLNSHHGEAEVEHH